MNFIQFLFQQEAFVSSLLKLIIFAVGVAISILVEILIVKYLIRYGVNYFFRQKTIYDSQRDINKIQQDIIKDHGEGKP